MSKKPQRVMLGKPVGKKANYPSSGKQFQHNNMKKRGNISEAERQTCIFMPREIWAAEVKNVSEEPKMEL